MTDPQPDWRLRRLNSVERGGEMFKNVPSNDCGLATGLCRLPQYVVGVDVRMTPLKVSSIQVRATPIEVVAD